MRISIHAPRTGSDISRRSREPEGYQNFNPRSPHGERHHKDRRTRAALYFNPRSPHGERPDVCPYNITHLTDFNPRSPHGERQALAGRVLAVRGFQSTLPARGATKLDQLQLRQNRISIHAPRTGSDIPCHNIAPSETIFQSTLPARGATCPPPHSVRIGKISIHAPRTGSDVRHGSRPLWAHQFQSTLPARGATVYATFLL